VDPDIVPIAAVIVVEPTPNPKANPALLTALLILATAEFDDPQTTDCKVDVLRSLNVPVAVNCSTCPTPVELLPGVRAIDTSPAGVKLLG
jgi:hypothetical protein